MSDKIAFSNVRLNKIWMRNKKFEMLKYLRTQKPTIFEIDILTIIAFMLKLMLKIKMATKNLT